MTTADEVGHLRAILALRNKVDGLVEEALRDRQPLEVALARILPAVCAATNARGAFVHTFDEDLIERRTFRWPADLVVPDLAQIVDRTGDRSRAVVTLPNGTDVVIAQPLDVAGEWFGSTGLVVPASHAGNPGHLHDLLDAFSEEIDNFLHSIRSAREKHHLLMGIARALRAPIFFDGLEQGVSLLRRTIDFSRLLVVYTTDEPAMADLAGATRIEVQHYVDGKLECCTLSGRRPAPPEVVAAATAYLRDGDRRIAERLGFQGTPHEEVLSTGGAASRVVGKILATSKHGSFNTHDRELLAGFAGSILDRVVDFHKEWRTLARSFRPSDVARLLQTPGYERFLDPQEQNVAILFADISGFTRISEQVLVTPSRIFGLVDTWGRAAVSCIWEQGGVFDKMVGDCVVALFGPPFYESSPGERLAAAIRAALAIRRMTHDLPGRPGLEHLADSGIGVSTGVNLAPAMVGRFGPSENFTAFSSGMNNTARLQHCATKDEIVVMSDAIAQLAADAFSFGDERSATVKNVAAPLRFRAVAT